MADRIGGDAEEAPGDRGRRRVLHLGAQGSALRTQEEARKTKQEASSGGDAAEHIRARRLADAPDVFSRKNSGVESRANRDKLELKSASDGSASYAALEKKAELYEKLCRGELPDEDEVYCVDFFRKNVNGNGAGDGDGADADADADAMVLAAKLIGPGRTSALMDRDEHKRFVREVHEEASEAREKASEFKLRRREQEAARRDRLRQAYLRKQLDKLKAAQQIQP
ncbi:unnamed protein product [Spirodela intermedia]|uniref:Uncharacterized protein n=1 Tax=Spirodela intermedia TaxID=51605 RepID=A0A7I8J5D5_SPIIN|nr:unnamed protein product [Spirodela intermedia]CAA6665279.1 unnamed protein product [Spirodela intermedia]